MDSVAEGDYELNIAAGGYKTQIMRIYVAVGLDADINSDSPKGEGMEVWGKGPTLVQLIERIANLEKAIDDLKKKSP